MPSVEILLKVI